MDACALWERYKTYLVDHPSLGLRLDISRMKFGPHFVEEMAAPVERAFDAMAQLEGDAIAVIFGTGSQEQALKDKAQALGIGRRVIFAGLSTDMENVYPAFDVFCLPSRFEGLPLAALEAQACGAVGAV